MVRTIAGFGWMFALVMGGCGGTDEELRSSVLEEPSIVFDVVPPDVDTDWPDVPDPDPTTADTDPTTTDTAAPK